MLVLMFLCDQSYASHGRDFLLGATILNPNGVARSLDRAAAIFFLGFPVGRSVFFLWDSSLHTATPKNLKVFGLGGGVEARGPQKTNRQLRESRFSL